MKEIVFIMLRLSIMHLIRFDFSLIPCRIIAFLRKLYICSVMETNNTIEKKAVVTLKVIYNDDCAILDFLADINSRRVIHDLQVFIDDAKGLPGMLLHNCQFDDMVLLILYKSPFGFNDDGNNLILYADKSLRNLIKYFKNQLEHTSEGTGEIFKALDDITRHLYFTWASEQDENTPLNHMG